MHGSAQNMPHECFCDYSERWTRRQRQTKSNGKFNELMAFIILEKISPDETKVLKSEILIVWLAETYLDKEKVCSWNGPCQQEMR